MQQEKAKFFYFTREPLFAGRMDLFADEEHLNEKGTSIFSRLLTKKINIVDW